MFWSIFWAVAFVLTIIVEITTTELVSIWFMPGALASLILSFFDIKPWVQWVVFITLSGILLIFAQTVFRKKILKSIGKEKTDTDLLIGKVARVEEDIINANETGTVRINGQIWTARMSNDSESASVGEFVIIKKISGVKLICDKKENQ